MHAWIFFSFLYLHYILEFGKELPDVIGDETDGELKDFLLEVLKVTNFRT